MCVWACAFVHVRAHLCACVLVCVDELVCKWCFLSARNDCNYDLAVLALALPPSSLHPIVTSSVEFGDLALLGLRFHNL